MFFSFNDHKDDLYATLEIPEIKYIAESKDLYFQKVKEKSMNYNPWTPRTLI